jgi:hypothetical protein
MPNEEQAEDAGAPDAPWEGPWLGAMAQQTPVYPAARFAKRRLGYIRRGGKAPVVDKPIKTPSCRQGWYPLVDGGYVCGKYATLDLEDPRVRLGVKAPDLTALLPYKYAYNRSHGTPLYRAVPSREDMLRYEPYLAAEKKAKKASKASDGEDEDRTVSEADQPRPDRPDDAYEPGAGAGLDGGVDGALGSDCGEAPPAKPWWQRGGDEPVNVTLADLDESDGTLSKRMVKGFFIAVDRTFGWNNRMWYKTTKGLVAPADRMIIPKTPELRGLEIPAGVTQVGFIRSPKAYRYRFAEGAKKPTQGKRIERFAAFGLTGETRLHDQKRYRETVDGWWMREVQGTYTDPGPPPKDLGAGERWIDVNISRKTLLAYEGTRPVYAALISPGKRSQVKKRDHRTPTGTFRIREKHIATTMDGDGVVAGDIPYSIEDVPYVQYYDGSYALHGAFWHQNFGREQSHGCVNLSPADSKWLFWWTEPRLPRGWHGVWATEERRGTRVVIHD